uniref:helix-turn-helix transcriptional regulator n=1 Tax=uncultured Acinetobacter sp. TaxID=165433 RepID=UPI00261FB209|nr:AlpA family phage regulatory protein [uncultured Acinetobacter sp.]
MNAYQGQTFQMHQLINIKQVISITGLCRSTLYEMMDEDSPYSDPTFPKKVVISQKRIGWLAIEIHQWIEDKANNRNQRE